MAGRPRSTQLSIIEAAEKLFSIHPIDAVSFRQIGIAAQVSNKSAINYHFKDRESLLQAIWDHRLPLLEDLRRRYLDEIAPHGEYTPRQILAAIIMPNYRILDREGRPTYGLFFRNALRWNSALNIRHDRLPQTPSSDRIVRGIVEAMPDIPKNLLTARIRYAYCAFFDAVFERYEDIQHGRPVIAEPAFISEGLDMAAGICLRPPPPGL